MPSKKILVLVMAEEKWAEADYLRAEIESRGYETLLLDIGLTGRPLGECDITRDEIISLSGIGPAEAAKITDRGQRMPLVIAGGIEKVGRLHAAGEIAGVAGIGGTTGTQMGTSIMKALPFGFPKLSVSSTASLPGLSTRYIGTSDITLMHSVADFAGLNDMTRNVLARAAGAVCGMAEAAEKSPLVPGGKKTLAMTQMGLCEECAVHVRRLLEEKGWQVIGFAAAGVGDRALDEIISRQDIFSAVIELAPGGMGEELLGFTRAAGPDRLEAAGRKGLPQVVSLCAVNLGSPAKRDYKPEYKQRKKYDYDASRTFVRLSEDELKRVAGAMAEKLNRSKGPVSVVVPLGGWSSIDKRGTAFYDAALDAVFIKELKTRLKPEVKVVEVDADLDSEEFASAVARIM